MEEYSFVVENLSKSFNGKKGHFWEPKVKVLDNLCFSLEENKITGFLGANGAGKTTFLKILLQFINPESGSIQFNKNLGSNFLEVRKNLGYLPERPYFHPHLTGNEFLHYLGSLCEMPMHLIKERVSYWSKLLKIDYALDRELKFYSKGMLQRVGFLSALLHNPKLIILDEPLSGLDPIGRKEFKDIMKIVSCEGATIFFSSHIISDVEEVGQNVIFLKDGKINYSGSVQDKLNEHQNQNLYIIKYEENSKTVTKEFEGNLNQELLKLVDLKVNILNVHQKKANLEEIFYISNKEL